jgi:hypothetical protein
MKIPHYLHRPPSGVWHYRQRLPRDLAAVLERARKVACCLQDISPTTPQEVVGVPSLTSRSPPERAAVSIRSAVRQRVHIRH